MPIPDLYFAAERPVVERDGTLIVADDDRLPLRAGEKPVMRRVRFRTLRLLSAHRRDRIGCDHACRIVAEMIATRRSERSGRLIDKDQAASMEQKKREGYF